jgi:deoxycytidylate deaminase
MSFESGLRMAVSLRLAEWMERSDEEAEEGLALTTAIESFLEVHAEQVALMSCGDDGVRHEVFELYEEFLGVIESNLEGELITYQP